MNQTELTEFLRCLNWPYQVMTDSVMKAQYQSAFGPTKVLFHLRETGLRIAINPVLQRPVETGSWGRSVDQLVLALNKESQGINIGLDQDGDLYVKIDLPRQELNFEQFTYVLLNVCQLSEQLTVPVLQAQAYDNL